MREKEGLSPITGTLWGEEPPEKWIVEEGMFRFEVHLLAGLNVGLFTDMREHRRGIGRFAKKVLETASAEKVRKFFRQFLP